MTKVAMLGAGFIGDFYTFSLHGQRSRDRVQIIYSRDEARGQAFAKSTAFPLDYSMKEAVQILRSKWWSSVFQITCT